MRVLSRLPKGKKGALLIFAAVLVLAGIGGVIKATLGGAPQNQSSSDIATDRGLVGWWKMDGNAKDSTPYANNGTITSGSTLTTDRKATANSAYAFSGTAPSYINMGNSTTFNSSEVTFSAWIKPSAISGYQTIAAKEFQYKYRVNPSGNIEVLVSINGTSWLFNQGFTASLSAGNWYNVVTTISSVNNLVTVYVNGISKGSAALGGTIASYNTNLLLVGAYNISTGEPFTGSIDDVRVYSRAISSGEVTALYNTYGSGTAAAAGSNNLLAWYKLDGNIKDSSPYNKTGTLLGTASYVSDREGQSNSALGIAASGDMIDNAGVDIGNDWTISAWSPYPNNGLEQSGHWRTLTRGSAGDHQVIVQNGSYQLGAYDNVGATNFHACTPTFNVNTLSSGWHHFLVTQVGGSTGTMTFYIDGVQKCTISSYGSTTDIRSVGNYFGNGQQWGTIDDFRVYGRALSATEITQMYSTYSSQLVVSDFQKKLIGDWPLNGNAKDNTPYSTNGTISGAVLTADRKGRANSAYSFNGTTNSITLATGHWPSQTITVSAWVNQSTLANWYDLVSNNWGVVGAKGWDMYVNVSGTPLFGLWQNGESQYNAFCAAGSMTTGAWHLLTGTYDGTTVKFYFDGNVCPNTASVSGATLYTAGNVRVGEVVEGSTHYIDDVRIWDRALSATEIGVLYRIYR